MTKIALVVGLVLGFGVGCGQTQDEQAAVKASTPGEAVRLFVDAVNDRDWSRVCEVSVPSPSCAPARGLRRA